MYSYILISSGLIDDLMVPHRGWLSSQHAPRAPQEIDDDDARCDGTAQLARFMRSADDLESSDNKLIKLELLARA